MADSSVNGVNGATVTKGTNGIGDLNGQPDTSLASVEQFAQQSYDFVVVGGGTAGLTIAARLTEDPNVTVGVIEAGKNRLGDMLVDTPAMFSQMLENPEYDWMMYTTPQGGKEGKVHHIPRGKLLGGSSGINYMMYVRGSDADYDDWAILAEDPGWSAKAMKQYFRKHQTLEPFDESIKDRSAMPFVGENHGNEGPVRTSFNDWRLPLEDDVIKAADEVTGLSKKPVDPWSGDHIGFFSSLGSVIRRGPHRGKRSYAARGYFEPADGRPNLKVLCGALATNVELEGSTAKGVSFIYGGEKHKVNVKKEVILCGGTINSPQLLELSGIGDPEVLKAVGVDCKVELPSVGANLQDHVVTGTGYELAPGIHSLDSIHDPQVMEDAQKVWMETQGGPLTAISSTQGFFPYTMFAPDAELEGTVQSILDTPNQTPFFKQQAQQIIAHLKNPKSANLQFVFIGARANFKDGVEHQAKLWLPPSDLSQPNGITLAICLEYPVSRGSVHITSSEPTTQPAIDPQYLKHPADVAVLAAGMRFLDELANSGHLRRKLGKRLNPLPEVDLQDISAAKEAVQDWVLGEYHPCGTCSMGQVVDGKLRVNGVSGLRVADASIFPNHVSGNICSSVYAVAEKAADLIKTDYA